MEHNQTGTMISKYEGRPKSVTLLTVLVLIIGVINIVKFFQTLKLWDFLEETISVSPIYLALTGLIWGVLGLTLAWSLFRGLKWASKLMQIGSFGYVVFIWVDRILIRVPSSKNPNDPFMAGLSVLMLIFVYWTLSRNNVREYFGETNEH